MELEDISGRTVKHSSTPLSPVSLLTVSVTHSPPLSIKLKMKSTWINNSYILNCSPCWVWENLTLPHSIPPRKWIVPLSSRSTLYLPNAHWSLNSYLGYEVDGHGVTLLAFKLCLILLNTPEAQEWQCWQFGKVQEKPLSTSFKWKGKSSRLNKERQKKLYAEFAHIYGNFYYCLLL